MVSTRQMCGSAGPSTGNGSVSEPASSSNASNPAQREAAARTSVLRRTATYNSQPQSSPATLAFSASVVTSHNYTLQMQRSDRVGSSGGATSSLSSGLPAPVLNILDLPTELVEKIVGFLDYKNVSNLRMEAAAPLHYGCGRAGRSSPNMQPRRKSINNFMAILNGAFARQIKTTYNRFHSIKANMPRRESARRSHPLACECDIIETCYMRLSLLHMSMGKHIERGHCCFFPGAILDEVNAILKYISITPKLQRPYRVTDELFDLSTMAMEYFKDRIEPTLPGLAYFNKNFYTSPTTTKRPTLAIASDLADSDSNSPPQNHMVLRKGIRKIKQGMKMYNNQLSVLRTDLRTCKRKAAEQSKLFAEQQNLLAEHQKQTLEYANRLDENDKKNEEMARKFSTLLQELNKCKTELQFWRSKSPALPAVCSSCNQKVTPVVPPEDFQALVNQGVDPEHIIIINDDADNESDVSIGELKEFASPDESTTAKLLAVNSKHLKRKRPSEAQSNIIASTSKAAESLELASPSGGGDDESSETVRAGGYSPKLFYGNHQRSGVIVSPVSIKQCLSPTLMTMDPAFDEPEESKKARRVQKANRCVNTAGKRSK